MITPTKHMNLDLSVLRVASILLTHLARYNIMQMDEVQKCVERHLGADGTLILGDALNFLYILGKVDYHTQTDTLEFLRLTREQNDVSQ